MDVDTRTMAFEIGWDYALYGVTPHPDAPKDIKDGYKAGKMKFPRPQRKLDEEDFPFVTKWLLLRRNALKREKLVDEAVTPEFLKSIFQPVCPITFERMEQRGGNNDAWSIDRLNNNGAYAVGNLAFMSQKANKAKGDKSFQEVHRLASRLQKDELHEGLTSRQWLRMACVMYGPAMGMQAGEKFLPLATFIPPKVSRPAWFSMQSFFRSLYMCDADEHEKAVSNLYAVLGKDLEPLVDRILFRIADKIRHFTAVQSEDPFDVLVNDPVQDAFLELAQALSIEQYKALNTLIQQAQSLSDFDKGVISSWSLGTRGYLSPRPR